MNVQKLRSPFFLILFPFFFVLHGFTENYFFVSITSALLLFAIYIVASLVLTGLLYLLSRNLLAASLTAAFLLFIQFFFGHIHDLIKDVAGISIFSRYSFLVSVLLLLTVVLFLFLKKRRDLSRVAWYLNILFLILIGIDFVNLTRKALTPDGGSLSRRPVTGSLCDSCKKPDIYIITLDGYAGNKQLRDIFSFDNHDFTEQLGKRGFKTITNSESNYDSSPSSMASTLDMEYLTPEEINGMRRKGHYHAFKRINNNKLMAFLKDHGYEIFNYSIFKLRGQPAPIGGAFVPANARLITDRTFTSRFKKEVWINIATRLNIRSYLKRSLYAAHRDNEKLYTLTAENAARVQNFPKVVYTHFMMPHHPYYYDETGKFRNYEELHPIPLTDTSAYLSYLKFCNRQVLSLVDTILKHSVKPPVIVVMSDHGFRYFSGKDYSQYAFSNILSIHMPGNNYKMFRDTMTNVNLFRTILNSGFRQQLPLLRDTSFVVEF